MEYGDILELFAVYALFAATVFGLPWAGWSLWKFFKALADPDYKGDV